MVEEGQTSKSKGNNKSNQPKNQSNNNKKRKKKGKCYHCKKEGHYKYECKFRKKKKMQNPDSSNNAVKNLVAMISALNIVEEDFLGGLILVLPAMYARTRTISSL